MEQKSFGNHSIGVLYLVPTPIGNLQDMTYRAVEVLQHVHLILAEDTRQTIKLLNYFEIDTKMKSYHEHSKEHEIQVIADLLQQGNSIALVSDAGMPLINDPGHPLVAYLIEHDFPIVALPGANAALTALIASGLKAERFTYYGFFPREAKYQKELIDTLLTRQETAIFYESPYRLKKMVSRLEQTLASTTKIVIARELTKKHETYIRGTLSEVKQWLEKQEIKGECVVILEPTEVLPPQKKQWDVSAPLHKQVEQYQQIHAIPTNQAIKEVAKMNGLKRQEVYRLYHEQIAD